MVEDVLVPHALVRVPPGAVSGLPDRVQEHVLEELHKKRDGDRWQRFVVVIVAPDIGLAPNGSRTGEGGDGPVGVSKSPKVQQRFSSSVLLAERTKLGRAKIKINSKA